MSLFRPHCWCDWNTKRFMKPALFMYYTNGTAHSFICKYKNPRRQSVIMHETGQLAHKFTFPYRSDVYSNKHRARTLRPQFGYPVAFFWNKSPHVCKTEASPMNQAGVKWTTENTIQAAPNSKSERQQLHPDPQTNFNYPARCKGLSTF